MLRKAFFSISLVAIGLFSATTSDAFAKNETFVWKKVDGWQVRIDTTLHNGCFIVAVYRSGTVVRVGLIPPGSERQGQAYIMVGNRKWKSIEVGKDYNLIFKFDNLPGWSASARGLKMTRVRALYATTTKVEFFNEMKRKHKLAIFYQGKRIALVGLKGSYAAINEMARCQTAVRRVENQKRTARNKDPFAKDTYRFEPDPFSPRTADQAGDPFK